MANKSEKATPKKLRDARKKGQVAKSQDFPSAFTFIVSISTTLIMSGFLFKELGGFLAHCLTAAKGMKDFPDQAGGYIHEVFYVILRTSLPIMVITVFVGILVNFIVIGPMFATEALKPDLKKMNPVQNIKNWFKFKTIFEILKSMFKITGAAIIIYITVAGSIGDIVATAALPILGAAQVFNDFLIKVIIRVGIFFLAIALFDLIYQKKNFAKEMKMEKFEVKQEYKDTEGNPEIKGKRRQVAHEIAYQEGPTAVRRSKAVITNPTHLAVALEYDEENDPAPKVATMGKGILADKIIEAAVEYNVPLMRNVPLAHRLYEGGEIGDFIPEDAYDAVAEILKWISTLEETEINKELFEQ